MTLKISLLVNISNGDFLDHNGSNPMSHVQIDNHENPLPNNINPVPASPNPDNNLFDETFFREWLLDLVITINVWHAFLITAIECYLHGLSILYLILILGVYDVYNLLFLFKRIMNQKLYYFFFLFFSVKHFFNFH